MEIEGKVKLVGETKTFGTNGFRKRELVVTTDEQYPQHIPKTRMVLYPNEIKISKSMHKVIRSNQFRLTKNKKFKKVIEHCSAVPRNDQEGTWITDAQESYIFCAGSVIFCPVFCSKLKPCFFT